MVSLVEELDGEELAADVELVDTELVDAELVDAMLVDIVLVDTVLADTVLVDGTGEVDAGAVTMIVTGGALMSITEYLVVVTCAGLADGVMVITSVWVVLGPSIVCVLTI